MKGRIIKRLVLAVLLAASPCLAADATTSAPVVAEGVDWKRGVITVVGEGTAPETGNAGKRRLMAKRAAMVDGYRKLLEELEGVHITSETTVKDFETESDEVRSRVSGLVKGARLVEENITSDNVYEVRLELPMYGQGSLASAVLNTSLNRRRSDTKPSGAAASPSETPAEAAGEIFSGLIIDARSLGLKPAMAPAVLDDAGKELYIADIPFNENEMVSQGAASYVKSLEEAKSHARIGKSPLVIRANAVKGPFQGDVVIAADDAKRLLAADQASPFLKKLAVVIVH